MTDSPSVRASYLPIDHLEAEILAAPLWSTAAFQNAVTTLDVSLRQPGTRALWREVEISLLARFPGTSIDELIARRDRAWFPQQRSRRLIEVLSSSTDAIMQAKGKLVQPRLGPVPKSNETEPREHPDARARMWRWSTFALPPDLFFALANADSDCPVMLAPNLTLGLAERGFAEPHLHINAAVPFDVLWSALQFELSRSTAREGMLSGPGAEFEEGRLLGPWLLRCAICRLMLASFLKTLFEKRARWTGFAEFLDAGRGELERRLGVQSAYRIFIALREVRSGRFHPRSPPFALLRHTFAAMGRFVRQPGRLRSLPELRGHDPVSEWFPSRDDQAPDFQFTKSGLSYLRANAETDDLFATLFWQVVRLRVAFYRHVVQRPMTPGLQWFVRAYSRLNPANNNIPVEALMEEAVRRAGPGLRSLEFRVQPMRRLCDLSRFVLRVDEAAKRHRGQTSTSKHGLMQSPGSTRRSAHEAKERRFEVGIVFHFARSRGRDTERGWPAGWGQLSHAAPESNLSGYRYSQYYLQHRARAVAFGKLLTMFPRTLEIVRGVDLCGDERGVPLWTLRPLVEHVQQAADWGARRLASNCPPVERPMRVTVHAGEDFVHLLSGIRRVGEAIEFLPLREGDRIGHAVALGVEPRRWADLVQSVPVTIEERLMDLIWAWRLAMRATSLPELKTWTPWIRAQLEILAARIFDDEGPSSPVDLDRFQRALHDTIELRRAGFPSGPRPRPMPTGTWGHVVRWLTDRTLFRHAQQLVDVDVRGEVPLTLAAQRQVRLDIGRLGITIEVNPSSNLLIGHLGTLKEHPLWRLRPPDGGDEDTPPVRICIGSDDPITFATNLANEYQLVFDAMTESGMSADECDAWIDNVRQASLDSRFTVPRSDVKLTLPFTLERLPLLV